MESTEKNERKLMQPAEVRELFNISRPTEIKWRNEGRLPEPLVMSRRLFYRTSEINQLVNG